MNKQEEINKQLVSVEEKHFVGIGKMIFNSPSSVTWNIPHLHFLVDKVVDDRYEATVLEFGLVSSGKNEAEAIERLASQIHDYIFSVMADKGNYQQFIDAVDNYVMADYWRHYRVIEFTLAQARNDLSHEIDGKIQRAVKALIDEKTMALIDKIAKNNAQELVNEVKRMSSFRADFDFEYKLIKGVA
jgi:hypothetical protein